MLISPSVSASSDPQRMGHPFLNIIPQTLDVNQKVSPQDFTRTRNLPLPKVILCTLSLVGKGNHNGVDTPVGTLFRNARRSGLWPDAEAVHRSALSKARQKVPWEVFQATLHEAVGVAYNLWPDDPQDPWHGMSVYAIDGSKYTLPATETLRHPFDPDSGLDQAGKGHYPEWLVSTLYDVFRRLPVARTIVSIHGSDRDEAAILLPRVPDKRGVLFDRGDPSYDLFRLLTTTSRQYFIFRCAASWTFPAVEVFVKSGQAEAVIWLTPSNKALAKLTPRQRKRLKSIKRRVLLRHHPDGTVSVLITNRLNRRHSPREEIRTLDGKRWQGEDSYRDEKVTLQLETFHRRTPTGIRQELFAAMIMTVIARTLMMLAAKACLAKHQQCLFKHALLPLAAEAALLIPENPEQALPLFNELLQDIARVKYDPPATPRPSQPRLNKHPVNKWSKRNRQTAT